MTRRVLAIAFAVAAMYAAVLGSAAPAQAPEPEATAVEAAATPITTPAPTVAAATPAATPVDTATPVPSPVETTVATPAPTEAAPAETPAAPTPTATAPAPAGGTSSERKRRPNTKSAEGKIDEDDCDSTSTSDRDCESHDHASDESHQRRLTPAPVLTNPNGTPAPSNPGYSLATPGPARIGVPNFFIDKFRIPPFLLPLYQAAGMQYGVRWEILAAINEIETDYGRNLNISSAGALGWMQFMPATWAAYGVDANRDGNKDPFNPVDAIFAAARYLAAAGAQTDIRRAVFAYNHANWYVDSVLMRAQIIGGLPGDLIGSLTGLTQGRFPIHAKATYAEQLDQARQQGQPGQRGDGRRVRRRAPRHQGLLALAGRRDRRQRRPGGQDRPQPPPGAVREAPGRLREHVHVRPSRRDRPHLPGAQGPLRGPPQGAQAGA